MASNKDIHAWNPIPCKNRYTAFNTEKFTIHELGKGNPVYSEMMNEIDSRHTNMVFYDKAQPYPTQPDQDYISLTGTKKAGVMQTGILLDNPTTYMVHLDSSHFTDCGGYYFMAFYDHALYYKARLVARFYKKDRPVHGGWTPAFSTVIVDRILVRVFVSNKQNEETGCKDAKLCVYYLGNLTKKHGLGPKNWIETEPSTTCQLLITMPITYPASRRYLSTPTWRWTACNDTMLCMQEGQITSYTLGLATNEAGDETIHVMTRTVHDKFIHSRHEMSVSDDGSKLFITSNYTQHTHDIYGEDYYGHSGGCTHWKETQFVFNLSELTQTELPMVSNWILGDIASLDKNDKGEFTLIFHNPRNKRQVSIGTPFTLNTGIDVQYTHMNATPGRHYVIIGTCTHSYEIASHVYILDESDNAIYTYQLPTIIPVHVLTKFDISVFGDGRLMIGGFRHPHSIFSGETSTTYAVNPAIFIDTLKQAPIPDELIRLAALYL